MKVEPYLFLDGRCDEAIEFYSKAVGGGSDDADAFKESPDPTHCPPNSSEKVMHASIRIGDSTVLLSDGNCTGQAKFQGFSLSLTVANEAEAKQRFAALLDGGQVQMPLAKTFFSKSFGMLADRFGVGWMVYVAL